MRLYRLIKSILLPSLTASIAFSSCIMDNYTEEPDVPKLSEGSYYITLDIDQIDNSTRASGDLVNGDDESFEHLIGSGHNYILFFDRDEKLKEILTLDAIDQHPDICDMLEDLEIESKYVARFDIDEEYEVPHFCLVILNSGTFQIGNSIKIGMDKDDIIELVWKESDPSKIGRDGEYFTMSNTVYYKEDGTKQDIVYLPINVIHSADEAPNKDKIIHVHVERMLAKATFEYKNKDWALDGTQIITPEKDEILMYTGFNDKDIPLYNKTIHWKVRPTGWGINALETSSNLFRNITTNSYFNNFSTNHPEKTRSYWAEDPQYGDTNYAWQYRNAVNYVDDNWKTEIPHYDVADYQKLKNYSYTDLVGQNNFGQYVYFPENTYNATSWSKRYDKRVDVLAGSHLLVTAELLTDYGDGDGYQTHDIYRDRIGNVYKTEREVFQAFVMQFNHALQSNTEMKFKIFDWSGNNNSNGINVVAGVSGNFSLCYDGQPMDREFLDNLDWSKYTVEATIRHGDGQRLLYLDPSKVSITDENGNELKFYDPDEWEKVKLHNRTLEQPPADDKGNRDWDAIDDTDPYGRPKYREWDPLPIETTHDISYNMIDAIKSLLLEWTGPIDHFSDGKMYYYKPLQIKDDIYGSVRNAWYQYVLKDIQHIGTSVDIVDQPIVPDNVSLNDQMIEIYVNIIGWHDKWPDDQDVFVLEN